MATDTVRQPAVAGKFYPAKPHELRLMVEGFLSQTNVVAQPARVRCIVAPHAGFVYSGLPAAHAYARVTREKIKRVILRGCSHHFRFERASIATRGAFETPLGLMAIDEAFAAKLAKETGASTWADPHEPEHCLEVHLPFIQVAIGEEKIVPVLFSGTFTDWHRSFGKTLARMTQEDDLVVVSTDLSHYLSEEEAKATDSQSIDLLLGADVDAVVDGAEQGTCSMCGVTAVATAMTYCVEQDARDWTLLDYNTSARASGDTSHVVGYASVSMERDS